MEARERSVVGVTMLSHSMVHTYELSIPIFMTIWLNQYGVTEAALGSVVTLGYGLFGLGALPSGLLADRFGSRSLLVMALGGMAVSFLALSLFQGLWGIGTALVLWGVAASMHHPASLTLISKTVSRRGTGLAYHGMAGNLGIALGPLVTTVLLMFWSWRTVSAVLSLPAAGATVIALLWLNEDQERSNPDPMKETQGRVQVRSFAEFWRQTGTLFASAFLMVFGIVVVQGLFYRGILTFLPELFSRMPQFQPIQWGHLTLETGRYIYTGLLIVGILGQYLGGRLSDHIQPARGLMFLMGVLAFVAVSFIPLTGAGPLYWLLISGVLGLVMFMIQPLYQTAVALHTPAGQRGMAYGYTYLGVFGVGSGGAALTGWFLTYWNEMGLYLCLAVLALLGSACSLLLLNRASFREMPGAET